MPDPIDLRPLLATPHAAEMLMLARGQLNQAFRKHGLLPPDPMEPPRAGSVDPAELDDPAGRGTAAAAARYGTAFAAWQARLPRAVAAPVLAILAQTHEALQRQVPGNPAARAAVAAAQAFLLENITLNEAPSGNC